MTVNLSRSPAHRVLIVGATSAIATEVARLFARDGSSFFLVGRAPEKLMALCDDLKVRGAVAAGWSAADLRETSDHPRLLAAADEALGGYDMVLVAFGTLADQKASEASVDVALAEWHLNATCMISLLTLIANKLEAQRHGTLAAISSVAGDRGRKSNYLYGAAKAALSTFLQGLRARLSTSGVRVVTVKPGMVDTPMTAHLKKGPFFASPERVGRDIHRAMLAGSDIVYTPWHWRFVMLMIRAIPERLFKRLPL